MISIDHHNPPMAMRIANYLHYENIAVKFLPLLVLYLILIFVFSGDSFHGDEADYVRFSTNLSHGYYSPPDKIDLWFGPGYPLALLPFVLLELPWLDARLLNAFFLFGGILYTYRTFQYYIPSRSALFFSYLLGIYPPFLLHLHLLYTEILTVFLICGFQYHFCKSQRVTSNSFPSLLIASIYLGYLSLTKVFFGYVVLAGLCLFIFLYLWYKNHALRIALLTYMLALIFCSPYLFYTYSLTNKIFYWGNSGGMSLYWMSTPYNNELGDWQSVERVRTNPELSKNHKEFFDEIERFPNIQKDELLRRQAIDYITHHPGKFFKNYLANVSRLLFNYPYSYIRQKSSTLFYIIPNMFLVTISILCIYVSYVGRKFIVFEIYSQLLFAAISFGGTSLLSAYNRQLVPLVPVIALWIVFILVRVVKIEIRHTAKPADDFLRSSLGEMEASAVVRKHKGVARVTPH